MGQVQAGVSFGALEGHDQGFNGRLRRPHGIGGKTGVGYVQAGLCRLEKGHGGHAAGVVGMQLDGDADGLFDGLHQVKGVVGGKQSGHVLDAEGIGSHLLQDLGLLDEVVQVEDRPAHVRFRNRVADTGLEVLPFVLDGLHGRLKVALVVDGVKDPENVYPLIGGMVDKGRYHVVRVVPVSHQVLPAQEHLEWRVWHQPLQDAHPFPRVFAQEAGGYVKRGASPYLSRPEPRLVYVCSNRLHLRGAHSSGRQALMGVTQSGVRDLQGVRSLARCHCQPSCHTEMSCSYRLRPS